MTELRIDGKPLVIDDIDIQLVTYNPFADETLNHTYDISVSLRHKANAAALGHVGRIDRDPSVFGTPQGTLLNSGRTIIKGKLHLLAVDGDTVKLQLVEDDNWTRFESDNDTYNSGGKRIDTLLKGVEMQSLKRAATLYGYPYGDESDADIFKQDAIHMPVYHSLNDHELQGVTPRTQGEMMQEFWPVMWPQPYLLRTVERVYQAMGYTVKHDALLDSPLARHIVIISDNEGDDWGEHLPSWSVAKMTREVERLFNCQVRFNQTDMTVRIDKLTATMGGVMDIEILDDIELEAMDEGEGINAYENVSYDLDSDLYYKEADLTDEQLAALSLVPCTRGQLPANGDARAVLGYNTIDGEFCYFAVYGTADGYREDYVTPVRNYQHLGTGEADNAASLAIIPAMHTALYPYDYNFDDGGTAGDRQCYKHTTVAVSTPYERKEGTDRVRPYDIINEGPADPGVNNDDKMRVAVFNRFGALDGQSYDSQAFDWPGINVPFSINNADGDYHAATGTTYHTPSMYRSSAYEIEGMTNNLALTTLRKEFYWAWQTDSLHKFKVRALMPYTTELQAVRARVRNRMFAISSVTYTLTADGFSPVAEVELFPLKG